MSNAKVISLVKVREIKNATSEDTKYQEYISRMEKHELLDEMVRFQEERSFRGQLTVEMMVRGKVLFKALEEFAETKELRILASSYRKHLDLELKHALKKITS